MLVPVVLLVIAPLALAADLSDNAVEAGKEALSSVARFPWYDRSNDDVRRLHTVPRDAADSENRRSQWTKDNSKTATTTTGRRFSLFGPILQWIGITALVLLLGAIAFLIARAFLKEEITENVVLRKVIESARDVDRVEALPFQVRKATADFLAEARRLYEAGNYSEAIIYLFSYELVQLDKQHLIRLAKGKTNRHYLRELRQRPHLRSILETTMIAFEDAFFGRKSLTRDRLDECWKRLEDLQRELTTLERAAA
jgi:hypothetical protein